MTKPANLTELTETIVAALRADGRIGRVRQTYHDRGPTTTSSIHVTANGRRDRYKILIYRTEEYD